MIKTQASLFLYIAYFCQRQFSDWLLRKEADWRILYDYQLSKAERKFVEMF